MYNRKNNIAVIVRAFYEKKAYFDYIFKDLKFDIDKHVEKKYHES